MLRLLTIRLPMAVGILFAVSALTFLFPYLSGQDPAQLILRTRLGEREATPEALAAVTEELGLEQPLYVQYERWLTSALQGDFGTSFASRVSVSELIADSLVVTLILTIGALSVAWLVALPLGVFAATRPGSFADSVATSATQIGIAVPEYWSGPVLIWIFAIQLGWLPSAGFRGWQFLILPVLVLALRPITYFTQVTRAAMLDVLKEPYITAAMARGLRLRQTILRHGLRNILVPIVTLSFLWFAGLLGGAVIVEVIFAIPGMGRLVFNSVINLDIPVLQAGFLILVTITIVMNSLADAIYVLANPMLATTKQ